MNEGDDGQMSEMSEEDDITDDVNEVKPPGYTLAIFKRE